MTERGASGLLPWHGSLWQTLLSARARQRLPHALLFSGPEGVGKSRFARLLAHSLLCVSPEAEQMPCGRCRGCRLFQAGSHPDFRWLEPDPEGKSQEIRIDAIREVNAADHLTAQSGGYKITVITPADRMNMAAANSLLKTLEEPTGGSLLILITSSLSRLPATIRSRCQRVDFRIPEEGLAHDWVAQRVGEEQASLALGLSGCAPLIALGVADPEILAMRKRVFDQFLGVVKDRMDPVAIVEDWLKLDLTQLLNWISGWLIDMLRLQVDEFPPILFNPDQQKPLRLLAGGLSPEALHGLLQTACEAKSGVRSSLNPQLMLERLLIDWSDFREEK